MRGFLSYLSFLNGKQTVPAPASEHSDPIMLSGTRRTVFPELFALELSSQVQQLVEENFKGRSPAEAFTGAKIDLTGKCGEESGIEALQVGGFGAVFTNEPIGVLIRTSHSGRMGRRKEKGNVVECSGDFFVFGKLLAAIWRDRA